MSAPLLFVDDDRDDVELTMQGFRREGFEHEILIARDGKEALDMLHAAHEAGRDLPALVLADIKMPRMDGLELLRQIKSDSHLRGIPVVILTSSGYETDLSEAMRLGCGRYLRKPEKLEEYAAIVKEVRALMAATEAF